MGWQTDGGVRQLLLQQPCSKACVPHLDNLLERVQVLLHAVVEPQVGEEGAGEHPVQTVEQRVHAGTQVDQVDRRNLSWQPITAQAVTHLDSMDTSDLSRCVCYQDS